ncbi:MAG: hypothetical protein AAB599_00960 [Patescibacteria group bacterium]
MPVQTGLHTAQIISPSRDLFVWHAPVRPFKKRNKEFFTTVLAVAFLTAVIFFVIGGWLPVIVIASLVFLVYVLSTIAPEEVEHKITSRGVSFAGKSYLWEELTRFWLTTRFGSELLVIETYRLPGRLEFVIQTEDKEKLKLLLQDRLPYEEASPTFLDKAASWLSKRVPLEA